MKRKAARKSRAVKRPGRGGARPGAGRPRTHIEGAEKVTLRLPMDVMRWLRDSELSQSFAVIKAVRASPQYLLWRGEN